MVRNDKIRLPPEHKPVAPPRILEKRATACLKGSANTSAALSITRTHFLTSREKKQNAEEGHAQPQAAMDEAVKASAIVEHSSHCDGQLVPQVICHEEDFQLRKIKEAFFIRHNAVINRDKGKEAWPRGATDNASVYGTEDCRFESCRGRKPTRKFIERKAFPPGWDLCKPMGAIGVLGSIK
ncbi:hypothetical protein M513_08771 [Trichuris suis]|uniref:Uncharacterized protein n=1 Tax=Trichuris suis TaxID=68888 RepID=A0A085LZJ3_9BILA|nr:hypothetical protein M513_08771 [Trichuris suis]